LKIRRRFFSLDQKEFPGLDDLDKDDDLKGAATSANKHGSGVKTRSGLSTVDSFTAARPEEEPAIYEEQSPAGFEPFERYMLSKDQTLQDSTKTMPAQPPALLHHWKLQPPSFFKMQQRPEVDDQQDWEYLSNPEGHELNEDQMKFIQKYYDEYAEKDPYAVMDWLYGKAVSY